MTFDKQHNKHRITFPQESAASAHRQAKSTSKELKFECKAEFCAEHRGYHIVPVNMEEDQLILDEQRKANDIWCRCHGVLVSSCPDKIISILNGTTWTYKGSSYVVQNNITLKHPVTREWVKAILYQDRHGNQYCRTRDEFQERFAAT